MSDLSLPDRPIEIGSIGRRSLGWWGVLCVIASEAALFGYLVFGYFYYAVQLDDAWLPELPSFRFSLPGVIVLILSSVAVVWAVRGTERARRGQLLLGTLVAFLLGLAFIVLQALEWASKSYTIRSGEYGSIFFTLTGFHLVHLIAGVIALCLVLIWSALGYFDARRNAPILITAAYWHFVVAVGVVVFLTLYVTPYLV